jgi:hypothetical protein
MAIAAFTLTASVGASFAAAGAPPATPPGLGGFEVEGGAVVGTFVQFEVPAAPAVLANYTSDGTLFFASVEATGYTHSSSLARGSNYFLAGQGAQAHIHDNPNAILKLTVEPNRTAQFTLGPSVSVADAGLEELSLEVSGSNRTGSLWWTCGNGSADVDAGNGSFSVEAADDACFVFFRSHIESSPSDLRIAAAASAMHVAAELWVAEGGDFGAAVYGASPIVVSQGPGHFTVSVGPRGGGPTSLVVRFVPPAGPHDLEVHLDGWPATQASDMADVLDPAPGAVAPAYAQGSTPDGYGLLLVLLPDGGPHVLSVRMLSGPVGEVDASMAGLILGVAFTGVAAAALLRGRR